MYLASPRGEWWKRSAIEVVVDRWERSLLGMVGAPATEEEELEEHRLSFYG